MWNTWYCNLTLFVEAQSEIITHWCKIMGRLSSHGIEISNASLHLIFGSLNCSYLIFLYTVLHIFRQVFFWPIPKFFVNKYWQLGEFFWVGNFDFFLTIFFASSQWKSVNIYRIARIFRIFQNLDDYPGFQPKTTPA